MHQYCALNDTVYFGFAANLATGAAGDGATPLYDVRLAGASAGAAPVLSGTPTLLTDSGYTDGLHEVAIAATTGNGFAAGNTYLVFVTLTISAVTPAACIGSFKIAPVVANVTQWLGTAPSTPTVAGVPNVNAKTWNDLATVALPLVPATPGRSLVVDAAGLADANAVKLGPTGAGTAQTARDVGASVLLSSGTGTGQLDFTAGVVKANFAQILGTAITGTAAQLAAAITKFFNVATPTGTVNSLPDAVAGAAGGVAIVGSNVGAATSVSGAVGSVTGNVGGNVAGSVGSVVSFGSLVADVATAVWGAASRTLSAFGFSVTVGTNNDKTGYSLATSPPTAAEVATAVWAAGTRTLTSFSTLVADVAAAVWAAGSRTLTAFGFTVTVGTNNDKTGYSLAVTPPTAAQVAEAVHVADWEGFSASVPAYCLLNALRFLRNKWTVVDGTLTIYEEDGTTVAWTGTVATDAAALPITGESPS